MIRQALHDVWQSDEDMAAMYLTAKVVTGYSIDMKIVLFNVDCIV